MILVNSTRLPAGYTLGLQPDGREVLVVVVKGTFTIPEIGGGEPELAKDQVGPVMTDVHSGEPGLSAPLYEIDFATQKPRCDVLLNGSAYAPGGVPTDRVTVTMRVGPLAKSIEVVGNRTWRAGLLYLSTSRPEPFTEMPISYNNAFGGVDDTHEDPSQHRWYLANHAGVGFYANTNAKVIDGKPLPNTEEPGRKVSDPEAKYRPMAFGPVARAWQPRVNLAGTYDQRWVEEVMPFLPADFDDRYYQAAPDDQQMAHPRGGEDVELINLTPEGSARFRLPAMNISVRCTSRNGRERHLESVLDTITFEPDRRRMMLVWRSTLALRKNIFEINHTTIG